MNHVREFRVTWAVVHECGECLALFISSYKTTYFWYLAISGLNNKDKKIIKMFVSRVDDCRSSWRKWWWLKTKFILETGVQLGGITGRGRSSNYRCKFESKSDETGVSQVSEKRCWSAITRADSISLAWQLKKAVDNPPSSSEAVHEIWTLRKVR